MSNISKEAIYKIIDNNISLGVPADQLENSPLNELNVDSLDLLTLNFKFQETFNVEINLETLTPQSTLGSLVSQLLDTYEKNQK
jgi:acyl carrier protein